MMRETTEHTEITEKDIHKESLNYLTEKKMELQ